MTYRLLKCLIEDNGIPMDVKLMSDSGWECNATEMDAIYYNSGTNTLIFTQDGNVGHTQYDDNPEWVLLYRKENDL